MPPALAALRTPRRTRCEVFSVSIAASTPASTRAFQCDGLRGSLVSSSPTRWNSTPSLRHLATNAPHVSRPRSARNHATDRIRRDRALAARLGLLAAETRAEVPMKTTTFPDERLELIFTCCHPALAIEAQVALTLRTLGGLATDEIARAFLVPE